MTIGDAAVPPNSEAGSANPDAGVALDAAAPTEAGFAIDAAVSADGLTVPVRSGSLRGKLVGQTREFLGVPYAQPPLGTRRFLAPEPVAPWAGTRDATQFGPSCMQVNTGSVPAPFSEDCLRLNVFAPATTPAQPVPVMVFIHGGAFTVGSSSTYQAEKLREVGNAVVVTLNYRLGVFGFLAHPALDAAGSPYTNQGIRDQQLALAWVRDNIRMFGGDPSNVTVFGESAGSVSVCTHLFAKGSENLGQRFIMESGSCAYGGMAVQPKAYAIAAGEAVVQRLCAGSADLLTCLRGLSADALTAFVLADPDPILDGFWPFVDGQLFTEPPESLLRQGKLSRGAMILGTNRNEWLLWHALGVTSRVLSISALNTQIERFFPTHATAVKAQYLPQRDADADAAFVRVMTDYYFRCPTRALARGATAQTNKAFMYSFEVVPAPHAMEVDYVFDQLAVSVLFLLEAPIPLIPNVVRAIQGYWTNFAKTGDPNGTGVMAWPAYATAGDQHVVFNAQSTVASGLAKADCDFWDKLWE